MNKAVIKYTFFSLWKQKSYSLSVFYILFNIISLFYLKTLTDAIVWELFISVNVSAMLLITFFFNVLWSWSEIGQDIKDKRIYILLGRGIKKSEYFFSKTFAVYFSVLFNMLICSMILLFEYIFLFKEKNIYTMLIIFIVLAFKLFVWNSLICCLFLLFSFFKGFFISFFIYFYYLILSVSDKHDFNILKKISYTFMIDQNIYSECIRGFIMQKHIPLDYIMYVLIYSFLYSYIVLSIGVFLFERKQI